MRSTQLVGEADYIVIANNLSAALTTHLINYRVAARRAGCDHGAGFECEGGRQELDQFEGVEDEIVG